MSAPEGILEADRLQEPSDGEFTLLQTLIEREAGIHLAPAKKPLLVNRLRQRLRVLGITSFGAYYRRIVHETEDELVHLLDAICTYETHFFREPHHFEFLSETLLPRWKRDAAEGRREKRVRLWSAGCSTGEEPYSLSMLLLDRLPVSEGWSHEIHATDLSTKVLAKAETAIYAADRLAEVPVPYHKAFLLRGVGAQEGRFRVSPEARGSVRFERLNLTDHRYAMPSQLDLLLCRHVLIYFRPDTRARVVAQLVQHLRPGGLLFLGHAESLQPPLPFLRSVIPTVYQYVPENPERG